MLRLWRSGARTRSSPLLAGFRRPWHTARAPSRKERSVNGNNHPGDTRAMGSGGPQGPVAPRYGAPPHAAAPQPPGPGGYGGPGGPPQGPGGYPQPGGY